MFIQHELLTQTKYYILNVLFERNNPQKKNKRFPPSLYVPAFESDLDNESCHTVKIFCFRFLIFLGNVFLILIKKDVFVYSFHLFCFTKPFCFWCQINTCSTTVKCSVIKPLFIAKREKRNSNFQVSSTIFSRQNCQSTKLIWSNYSTSV